MDERPRCTASSGAERCAPRSSRRRPDQVKAHGQWPPRARADQSRSPLVAFGDGPAIANELAELVLTRTKRATACLACDVVRGAGQPVVSGCVVTIDGAGAPQAISAPPRSIQAASIRSTRRSPGRGRSRAASGRRTAAPLTQRARPPAIASRYATAPRPSSSLSDRQPLSATALSLTKAPLPACVASDGFSRYGAMAADPSARRGRESRWLPRAGWKA